MARNGLFDDSGYKGFDEWYSDECEKCSNLEYHVDEDKREEFYTCKSHPYCEPSCKRTDDLCDKNCDSCEWN